MRQTCVATILAQTECYIIAKEFIFTLINRVFTRVGATDKIGEGKSTFFIEFEEAWAFEGNQTELVRDLGQGGKRYINEQWPSPWAIADTRKCRATH